MPFFRENNLGISIKIKNLYTLIQRFYCRELASFFALGKLLGAKTVLGKYSLSKLINEFVSQSHISSNVLHRIFVATLFRNSKR
jgi:hypothetical protein